MKKPVVGYLLSFAVAVLVVAAIVYAYCPRPELKNFTTYSTAFFDSNGGLLKLTLAQDQRYRLYQPLERLSPDIIEATVLYEDKNFYQHCGVDFPALVRAFWTTYIQGGRRIGASTIVMQVARLRWNISSSTIWGKTQQILRAIQLARHYSKQQILEAYLNMAPYGGNIEGIAAASLIYFNKSPQQLSLPEVLTLAVIPQNPNRRTPTNTKGYKKLQSARLNLFQRWLASHPEDAPKQKYLAMPLLTRSTRQLPAIAPHFTQYLLNNRSYWDHGIVNTTLDSSVQRNAEQVVRDYVSSKAAIGIKNAAALLLNYQTMEIKAMVGAADFYREEIQGQVNGTTAKRSPGSTLKPFVYGLAIDEGLIHPMSLLKDSPRQYGGFTPENYDKRFLGPIVAKDALIQSRNVPAVELQSRLTKQSFYDFLQQAGVSGLQSESFYGLALALGGGELTMVELVRLYSVLANQGVLHQIKTHFPIQHRVKNDVNHDKTAGKRVLSAEASLLVLDMLKDNPAPDALNIDSGYLQHNQVAWKTGTSWAFRDAWAIGVSGPYVLAVWVGNFDGQGNNAFVGRSAAGPLLFSLFDSIVADVGWTVESTAAMATLNLKKVEICANTGDLYQKNCPTSASTWFIPGVSPIKVSNIYRKISVDKSTGLRSCRHLSADSQSKVFEFWPSDFLHVFSQAGISLKTPPRYGPECSLDQTSSSGLMPVISSPQSGIEYVIPSDSQLLRRIVFSAVVDSDVEQVFWFVNGKFEGSAKRGAPFIWQATNGHYLVTAVDDSGRAASQEFKVVQVN